MPFRLEVGLHCLTMSNLGLNAKKPNFDACIQQTGYYRGQTCYIFLDVSLTVKAATLIFISECGSAFSSAKEGKSGFIYNLVKR